MKTLFITGSSGFIGSHLIKQINPEGYKKVYCLSRQEVDGSLSESLPENIRFIKGDILKPESYERYLSGSDIVIHLAALTGKIPREEYFRVNSEGTRVLIERCRSNDIKRFIFISSIAADFRNIEGYHYAESKIEAERIVKRSGISFTIIRPTIVTGKGSPIIYALSKLAKAPVVPVFDGGKVLIQPVYIDDLTACILKIIEKDLFQDQTVTVAGPERITMKEFIRGIHRLISHEKLRMISLPARPIAKVLLKLEDRMLPYLPFTAGQLASFTNDGISKGCHCPDDSSRLKNINEMLRLSLPSEEALYGDVPDLERECRNFANYLIEYEPDGYILSKYIRGHKIIGIDDNAGFFDSLLVKAANRNKFLARLADTYASVFYKNAVIRKKLLLLLSILECYESTHNQVDTVNVRSRNLLYLKVGQKAFVFLLRLATSIIVFTPFKFYSVLKKAPKTC